MNNDIPPDPEKDSHPPAAELSGLGKFWTELKRRKVMRVAITYAVVAWLIIQIASVTFSGFGIPEWAFRFVTLMLVLGFPVALIITWAFEITPEGIKTTRHAREVQGDEPASKIQQSKRNWATLLFAAGLPTVIFGALAIFFYIRSGTSDPSPVVSSPASLQVGDLENSIAVLPLINMSAMEDNTYFAGGVHEDILTNLSRIRNMEVVSRTTMLRYAASELTLQEIGEALKVKFIVEGSVRRIGNHVRVTIQLIDAVNDRHMWANNFERELVDVFATQSELAKEISNSLHLEIQPDSVGMLEGMPTTSVKAYDLYTRAANLEKTEGETEESMIRRREMLEQAVEIDPDFVEAWGHLKRLYDLMVKRIADRGWYLEEGSDQGAVVLDLKEKSKRAMAKAQALDPNNFETLLASVVDHVWPQPEAVMQARKQVLDKLAETYPDNAMVWYHLAWWHNHVEQRGTEAMAAFEKALELDPFNARFVRAVLDQYRNMEDQPNITRLLDRLSEIIPETTEDRWLARLPWPARLRQIRTAFLETADESLIQEYESIWKESKGERVSRVRYDNAEVVLCVFTNNRKRILELAENNPLEQNLNQNKIFSYISIQSTALAVQLGAGADREAEILAKTIIEAYDRSDYRDVLLTFGGMYSNLVMCHSILGETDKAQAYLAEMQENLSEDIDYFAIDLISGEQYIDLEKAVAIALEKHSKQAHALVFDYIAAYHMAYPKLINHPKIQAHYMQDGKWMDYLAKRIPEYAELKKANQ